MSEIISQTYRGVSWAVDTEGAQIVSLEAFGARLLFPQTVLHGKTRGGLFACVPQFGPDNRSTDHRQEQHGFGRKTEWRVGRLLRNTISLTHVQEEGEYAGLSSRLHYRFADRQDKQPTLLARLTLHNDSDESMRIAPAFHPYFDISRLPQAEISQMQNSLEAAPTIPTTEAAVHVAPDVSALVRTKGFGKMTWWSDAMDSYVCAEPSLAGPSFAEAAQDPQDIEILQPGAVRDFEMSIVWRKR